MPGPRSAISVWALSEAVSHKMRLLGIQPRDYIFAEATRSFGPTSSRSKEADLAFLPSGRVASTNFPSFVIEVGVSEEIAALRRSAHYWIVNSSNACKLVLLMSVRLRKKALTIELNLPVFVPGRVTGANPNSSQVLRAGLVHPSIVLRVNGVTSGPADLRLPLAALFDSNPVPTTPALLSQDVVVKAADLQIVHEKVCIILWTEAACFLQHQQGAFVGWYWQLLVCSCQKCQEWRIWNAHGMGGIRDVYRMEDQVEEPWNADGMQGLTKAESDGLPS